MNERPYLVSERKEWHRFFFDIIDVIEKQSTCLIKHVGALLVDSSTRRVISMGFNGAPAGIKHPIRCVRKEKGSKDYNFCICVHSEMNCIIHAALYGLSTKGATLYCGYFPCMECMKALINAQVTRLHYRMPPVDPWSIQLASEAGIEIWKYENGRSTRVNVRKTKLPWE